MIWLIAAFVGGLVAGIAIGAWWANWAVEKLIGRHFGW